MTHPIRQIDREVAEKICNTTFPVPASTSSSCKEPLKAGIAKLLADSYGERWISVDDQLPKDHQKVEVYCEFDDEPDFAKYLNGRFIDIWQSIKDYNDRGYTYHYKVTHWRPLPPAPGREGV